MNYQIYKKDNKYQFLITEDKKVVFASSIHFFLIPNIRSEYEYAWKSCYDARHIIHNQNHHLNSLKRYAMEDMGERVILDISAEQMLINHYLEVFENLKLKAKGCIGTEDKERVKKEIDIVKEQMNKIIEKIDKKEDKKKLESVLFHIKKIEREYKIASVNKVQEIGDEACKKELMEEYGYKICEAIQQTHRDCVYNIKDNFIDIYNLEDKEQILKIEINDRLHICSILPLNKLAEIYPYHSWEFYQKYWKLIIENVGHFYINDLEVLIAPVQFRLPDIPVEDKVFIIKGFDVKNCEEISVGLKFKKIQDGKDTVWMFNSGKNIKIASSNPSKYNEQDYSNAIVKCIDPALKSIYGRTGCVIEVVPLTDYVLLDVDFGRGLDVIRIKEEQIEIVKV